MNRSSILIETLALGGDGLCVAIKDSIDIAGYVTGGASAALVDSAAPTHNAAVVDALLNADCRIVGKANMHELAFGVTGINNWSGTPENPLYPRRIPGGSSSGSAAAVAAGLCDFALGTDTGGSIRMPAACCGVFGLKPSFGRVSRRGVHPAQSSLDCVGPLAPTMALIEAAMAIIDPTYIAVEAPSAIRLGAVECSATPEIRAAFEAALQACDAEWDSVRLNSLDAAFDANVAIIGAETYTAYAHLIPSGLLGTDVRMRLEKAAAITPARLADAEMVRLAFQAEVDAALDRFDALILPTLPAFPPTIEDAADAAQALALTALVRPFNLSGHPAITIPVGTPQGLPAGIQLVGRRGGDEALCAIARRFANSVQTLQPTSTKEPVR